MQKQYPYFILLCLLLALPIFSSDIYLPSIRAITHTLQASYFQVQMTLTGYFLVFGIMQLFCGALSDRYGRRPIMLISLLIYLVATLICMLAPNINTLIMARIMQAIGGGSSITVFAIVRDLQQDPQHGNRWTGYLGAVVASSVIIAPLVGGYIQSNLGWRWNFALLLITGIILLILAAWRLPETHHHRNSNSLHKQFSQYAKLLFNRQYIGFALNAGWAFGALFAFVSGAPLVFLHQLHYSPEAFSRVLAVAALGYVLGALMNGRLTQRFGVAHTHRIGTICLISGGILMVGLAWLFPNSGVSIYLPQILCEVGIGISVTCAISQGLQPIPKIAGSGSALIGFMRFSAATISSVVVVVAFKHSSLPLALTIFGCILLAVLSLRLNKHVTRA